MYCKLECIAFNLLWKPDEWKKSPSETPDSGVSLVVFLVLIVVLSVLTSLDLIQDLLVGVLEGLFEAVGEGLLAEGSLSLLGTSSLGSLLLEGSSTSSLAALGGLSLGSSKSLGSRVESLHGGLVGERVLLALGRDIGVGALHAELGLDLIGVDDSSEVGAGHHVSAELESALLDTALTVRAEDVVELLESVLGENDESAEVTTRGELEEVESADVANINTWEVSGSLLDKTVLVTVNDERALGEGEAGVAHLALTGSQLLGLENASEVTLDTEVAEGGEESGGLLLVEAVDNERELRNIVDLVASGHDERTAGSSGEG